MTVHDLPAVNASLNATATVLLLIGYSLIRQGKREQHRKLMLAAFGVSILFLICYVIYHAQVGSVKFQGQGWVRPVYFAILISHVLLAATVPVFAVITLRRALKGDFVKHRKIARITYPIWLYVSVTGVIVYLMLYHMGNRSSTGSGFFPTGPAEATASVAWTPAGQGKSSPTPAR